MESVERLARREGWQSRGVAARVHYRGEGEGYSVEFYPETSAVLYWRVGDEVAVPVERAAVPDPLRERIREDLAAADVDPDLERETV